MTRKRKCKDAARCSSPETPRQYRAFNTLIVAFLLLNWTLLSSQQHDSSNSTTEEASSLADRILLPLASADDERAALGLNAEKVNHPEERTTTQTASPLPTEPSSELPDTSTQPPSTEAPTFPTTTTSTLNHMGLTPAPTKKPATCPDAGYCLNGGTCVLIDSGQMICICPEGFYGARCQTRNICKTIILDNLTGDQICAKIGRDCWKNDKFFRCNCKNDEYFIFKTNQQQTPPADQPIKLTKSASLGRSSPFKTGNNLKSARLSREENILAERFTKELTNETLAAMEENPSWLGTSGTGSSEQNYLAECRKVDKCLGVRCRQLSEVCQEGVCVCNQDAGYMLDPSDKLCKLLDPCQAPTDDGKPICGQAQCVATYDKELFKCVCPIGYQALRVGSHRNSTVCTILRNLICRIPLLNKCQHICQVDSANNNYKCSCLRGYLPGKRVGVDDHMCFFIEQADQLSFDDYTEDNQPPFRHGGRDADKDADEFVYRPYPIPKKPHNPSEATDQPTTRARVLRDTFTYDPLTTMTTTSGLPDTTASTVESLGESLSLDDFETEDVPTRLKPGEIYIKREKKSSKNSREDPAYTYHEWLAQVAGRTNLSAHHDDMSSGTLTKMSAQERCNMFCDENKICELEVGSFDSYRCVCNRQGFVSVGDRCLDWCAAAEFEWQLRGLLDYTCWSGACKTSNVRPGGLYGGGGAKTSTSGQDSRSSNTGDDEASQLEQESSWRPTFECDCSNSPLLLQDPQTKLCKFDFQAAINPCLPGNEGYIDCVENKNAYCAVLYKQHKQFISEHQRDRFYKNMVASGKGTSVSGSAASLQSDADATPTANSGSTSKGSASNKNINIKDINKLYTCVCSPEKKFLVDKPRKKERCVDECDLLNVECGRFNRMCRSSTMELDDFGHRNLIHLGPEGARIDFKRTGCECLPGFNVGPSESIDFTIDDNNPSNGDGQNGSDGGQNSTYIYTINDPIPITYIMDSKANTFVGLTETSEQNRAKYININSRCLLDYDVVEFHATFKVPVDFNPNWIKVNNAIPPSPGQKGGQTRTERSSSIKSKTLAESDFTSGESADKSNSLRTGFAEEVEEDEEEKTTDNKNGDAKDYKKPIPILQIPEFMTTDISELNKHIVLIGLCDPTLMPISVEAFSECTRYRYWIVQKLRHHYIDWRRVITNHLKETFDLMEGNIRLRVNKCNATLKSVNSNPNAVTVSSTTFEIADGSSQTENDTSKRKRTKKKNRKQTANEQATPIVLNPHDQQVVVDANINCELTLHSASDDSLPRYARKVLLEKQLQKFIFPNSWDETIAKDYYLMAPNMLIERDSFDQLAKHRKEFNPCKSDYTYCEKQTRCEMVDTVNFTCTCEYGYTPIGSRDIYYMDSRKEVCEDINECLFDVCKEQANVSTCINEIGDYRCQCNRHYIGDNKRYCKHVCDTISCKHGKCRLVDDHHAFCECDEGYKETDCSVQDPNVALRKANMIICGSIFTSVLLLLVTFAISLNNQLKKTKRKLKQLEAATDTGRLYEFANQQPFRPRLSKVSMNNV